jgi:hypothetical protein
MQNLERGLNGEQSILESLASYQTVNILELMSLTPGLDDAEVSETVQNMRQRDLVSIHGEQDDQLVSLTPKGWDYYSSQMKLRTM